jgi:hypothetical protein
MSNPPGMPGPPPLGLNIDKYITDKQAILNSINLQERIQDY